MIPPQTKHILSQWGQLQLFTWLSSIRKHSKNQFKIKQILLSVPHWTLYSWKSLHKSLGDSVCVHPIKITGLWLCKLSTPSRLPLTARPDMTLAEIGAIIALFYFGYSFAAISLITGLPGTTVCNFVDCTTDRQSLEYNPHSSRPWILTR